MTCILPREGAGIGKGKGKGMERGVLKEIY